MKRKLSLLFLLALLGLSACNGSTGKKSNCNGDGGVCRIDIALVQR